jgi:hypothetical protein
MLITYRRDSQAEIQTAIKTHTIYWPQNIKILKRDKLWGKRMKMYKLENFKKANI